MRADQPSHLTQTTFSFQMYMQAYHCHSSCNQLRLAYFWRRFCFCGNASKCWSSSGSRGNSTFLQSKRTHSISLTGRYSVFCIFQV